MKYLCYLAGPITGESYGSATDWRERAASLIDDQIDTLSPLRGKHYLSQVNDIQDTYESVALSSAKGITARDFNDCRRSDAILANLLEADKVSIGTVMEIAWGKAFNVPVVVVMDTSNVHWHAMIRESSGFIVDSLEEGCHIVNCLLCPTPTVVHKYSEPELTRG